ncbi:MAG TPA: PQQ-binding-like beta-propeller repeat protein [Vicinamibacterales bacterium]|nr:PQQ-binding-like beta-propeller repeat protein [Vicinamibacterales bacterium]
MNKPLSVAAATVLSIATIHAADWPQWQGADRTRVSRETGLLKQWPANGPSVVWTASGLGNGYGSMAVAGERVYVQGTRGGNSIVVALNRADGKEVWSKALGRSGDDDRGPGPRGTPTVDGDRLYVLTENGDLASLKTDGTAVWQRNILREFGGRQLQWLISESPLVDGAHLVVSPGGPGAGMVKLDKMTGRTVWQASELSDPAGYSSAIAADVQGVRTYLTFTAGAGVGVRASDGKVMFRYDRAANRVANITTPVFFENKVFFTSAYDTGAGLVSLSAQNGAVSAQEVYFTREMKNHHGGVVLHNGYLYGFDDSILTCLEFASGKRMWRDRSVGKGSLILADGDLYILGENNTVGLAAASSSGYQEKGRFSIADKGLPSWAHPVVSGGRLYIRNQDSLMAYDVKAK